MYFFFSRILRRNNGHQENLRICRRGGGSGRERERVLLGVTAAAERRGNPTSLIWGVGEGFRSYEHAIHGFSSRALYFGP